MRDHEACKCANKFLTCRSFRRPVASSQTLPSGAAHVNRPWHAWGTFTELYEDWRFRLWRIADGLEDSRFDALAYTYPDGNQRPRECFDFAFGPQGNVALRDGDWIRVHDFETQRTIARLQQRHVVKSWGTGGLHLLFARDHRLLTRTDRGIVSVYDLGEQRQFIS